MCFLLAVRGGVPFPVCPWGQLRLPAASRRGPASVLPSPTRFPATAQRPPPPVPAASGRGLASGRPHPSVASPARGPPPALTREWWTWHVERGHDPAGICFVKSR